MEAALAVGLLGAALAGALAVGWRKRADGGETARLERRTRARLEEALPPGVGTHLDAPLEVEEIAVRVDERGREGYVPVVRVDLGTVDAPGTALLFDFVAPILEAVAPAFEGERVHHYDVRFSFGPDGLLVSGSCRRIAVTSDLVARLEEPSYRAHDLRRDVERRDDGGDRPPVVWGECVDY